MALLSCKELHDRNSSIAVLPKGTKQYTRSWQVIVDSVYDDAVYVENYWANYTGVVAGTAFPNDAYAVAKDIKVNCTNALTGDEFRWLVTCNYGSIENEDQQPHPLLQPAKYEWSFAQFSEVTQYDVAGTPIVNSAGDMYLGGVQRDNSRPVLKVTTNAATFSPLYAAYYKDSINGNVFLGANPKCVKISNISAKNQWDAIYAFWYWVVNYEFQFDFRTWDALLVDQGLRYYDSAKGEALPILDGGGEKISEPVMLDGTGQKLAKGGTPTIGKFTVYPILPFNFSF